ncbi:MAG: choice-of-anchor O protein [Pseudomonadota bacterium]
MKKKLKIYGAGVLACLFCTGGSALGASNFGPGGLMEAKLFSARLVDNTLVEYIDTGTVQVWNTRDSLQVKIAPLFELWQDQGWKIRGVDLYVGEEPVPVNADGTPIVEAFTYRESYGVPISEYRLALPFQEAMQFSWGEPYEDLRFQNISVHADMVQIDVNGMIISQKDVWTFNPAYEVQSEEYETVVVGANTVVERDVRTKVVPVAPVGFTLDVQSGILSDMLEKHWGFVTYEMAHPKKAHFIDSPVAGMRFKGPTQEGMTDVDGGFDYFPGERVDLWVGPVHLGNPYADDKISPIDIFEEGDSNDPRVINMARFLQSLDSDGDTQGGITITTHVTGCLETAMNQNGLTGLDWTDDTQVSTVINGTIDACVENPNTNLVEVDAVAAKEHLESTLSGAMFRKNVSRTPVSPSSKAKMDVMGVWVPALKADGTPVKIGYRDENGNDIDPGQTGDPDKAKPLVVTYTDADPITGAHDVWIAISRDDGATWKRKNLSRMADRTSFADAGGEVHYGNCKKPVVAVKSNYIMVAWTSKYARGGKPRYSIDVCPDTDEDGVADSCQICKTVDGVETCEADYPHDDSYAVDDIWGVKGPQRSHDYTEDGYPLVGEMPYSALWSCRVVIDKVTGDITYFKPERLTSGRRDAYQLFLAGAGGSGFAMVWQEDPKGLQPGDAKGPGPGWGGATTSHKTDIWYSFLPWADFAVKDENFVIGGDPEHDFSDDFEGRPKALAPMSLPVRLTDNDAVNTDNLMVQLGEDGLPVTDENGKWIPLVNTEALSYEEADANDDGSGSHRYGYMVDGLCTGFHEFVNNDGVTKRACITADGRLLDGNTGASRPNIFLQPYYKWETVQGDNPATTTVTETEYNVYVKSAYAIVVYDETKGAGLGTPDHDPLIGEYGDEYTPDEGKNAHYHSFDFSQPELVNRGSIINHPETDDLGNPVYIKKPVYNEDGSIVYDAAGNMMLEDILDWQGKKVLAYENARRPRIVLQPKSEAGASKTVAVVLYKEGEEGKGRPSDIMMRRIVASPTGNPYAFANMVCDELKTADNGETVCVKGAQNLSTVTPTATWINPTAEPDARGDQTKVIKWEQRPENLGDKSGANPYEDARAHRGGLQGDFLVVGYTYTPNWAASRNAHDKYDFYVRRSFDGGQTWTTDPAGQGVTHTDTYKVYLEGETEDADITREKYTEETFFGAGQFEPAVNLSQLKNNKETVIEPRIVATPGQIWKVGPGYKSDGSAITPVATGYPEDFQDDNVVWMSYGTSENLPKEVGYVEEDDGEHVHAAAPLDLFYSFSQDKGEQYHKATWVVNPDSDGNNAGEEVTRWDRLAKGDTEQGEAQLRMTPDGSRFYAVWLQEGIEGSDIWMRRIMPAKFSRNVGTPLVEAEPALEE